ncbi:MAG: D-aminoacylase [Candidatus Doudnabacteria bacterium]|nr:D-aminoacylase [Candidatus Doudnabacteria bacterium]
MFDILLKNGEIIDGTGKKPKFKSDVAITGGKISEIAENIPESKAKVVIDTGGKFIVPGFIDIQNHSDAYWTLFDEPDQLSLISQGITSIIVGNCGSSLAPLTSTEAIKTIQKWHNLAGININWSTFAEFLRSMHQKTAVNVGSLVGHATLRRGLLGDQVRKATSDEIQIMDKLLSQSLEQGALGLSLGLVYAHEVNSTAEELLELSKNLKTREAYLSVHLRSEGAHVLESLDEVIEIAKKAGVALKISHFKIQNQKNWHLGKQALKKIEDAYHSGLDISFDVYPYHTSWSVLYTYLPKWAYEGGRQEILRMMASPVERKKILEYLKTQEYDYKNITVATSENNSGFIGKTVADIAANSGVSGAEALLNILTACKTQAVAFDRNLSDELVDELLASPLGMIATDGAGYTAQTENLVHPRCYGAMPRFLSWVREKKKISWEEAIRKITSEPARLIKITDRGTIAKNLIADLVVIDPKKVSDQATYEHPFQLSFGIDSVIVNGQIAYYDGRGSGHFGTILRRT